MSVRMLRSALIAGALSVVSAPAGLAQAPVPEEARAAMEPLAWLAGNWAGEATITDRGGTRVLHQSEAVRPALEGSLLVVDGTGRELASGGELGEVAFRAFAVMSAGDEAGRYRVAAWQSGRFVDARAEVDEGGTLTWGFATPDGGEVRYVIRQPEPDVWHETGAFRRSGEDTWRPFIEMTLRREPSGSAR
ncbi:MAG TPA: hypothetical protein VFS53_04760 [Gemmatimonadota bacterium]|nr:hypothetical protein [Gemmatimonadota bacterium]